MNREGDVYSIESAFSVFTHFCSFGVIAKTVHPVRTTKTTPKISTIIKCLMEKI